MKAVGVKQLKARLSEYLRLVKTGETILVTERDEVVAEMHPARRRVRAADELEDDQLSIYDLEAVILSGAIVELQRDQATGETKYVIRGRTTEGAEAECVVKIGTTGRLIVITVYRAI